MSDMPEHAPYEGDVISPARTTTGPVAPHNPFAVASPDHVSAGAVAIASQAAAAEVQGRMVVAKRFPRDPGIAYARAMQACQRKGLAECGIYNFPRGGSKVEGPSIRLAEELARCWGNIEYGLIELSRRQGESEMEAFAWDVETNTRSSQKFTVRHIRDRSERKGGNAALTDERDVYEITANMGARRLRARILAILPPELVDDAVDACKKTMREGGGQTLGDRIRAMMTTFAQVGVSPQMVVDRIGHPTDQITPDELVELRGVLQLIRDGGRIAEHFGKPAVAAVVPGADPFEMAAAGKQQEQPAPQQPPTTPPQDDEPPPGDEAYLTQAYSSAKSLDELHAHKANRALASKYSKLTAPQRKVVDDAYTLAERKLIAASRSVPDAR